MDSYDLQDVFIIKNYDLKANQSAYHDHNYFEIIFIEKGKGFDIINGEQYTVKKGNIFLIAPEDNFKMTATEPTRLCYFKFTEMLFSNRVFLPDRKHWLEKTEHILHHPNLIPGDCIKYKKDRKLIWHIHEIIILEYHDKKEYYKHVISNMVSTTLSIIARNLTERYEKNHLILKEDISKVNDIINYIREHIYKSDLIKSEQIAAHFNMSPKYIGYYFKNQTGETLQKYIIDYRLKLVKYRLRNTDFTISEIAYQLGFTDESHLTRSFKKRYDLTPGAFKKRLIENMITNKYH